MRHREPINEVSVRDLVAALRKRRTITTGEMARLCEVASRTVGKWCDSGKLPCYKLPGSNDRRILRTEAVKFLKEAGMPTMGLEEDRKVLLALSYRGDLIDFARKSLGASWEVIHAGCPMQFGLTFAGRFCDAVLLDWSVGGGLCTKAAAVVAGGRVPVLQVVVAAEDQQTPPGDYPAGVTVLPFDCSERRFADAVNGEKGTGNDGGTVESVPAVDGVPDGVQTPTGGLENERLPAA